MSNVIRHKRGTGNPVAGDFSQTAELLVNTTDGGLFTKTDGGDVVEVGKDVPTSGSSDALTVSHSTDTDITMSLYCESQTAKIADSFSDTTTDKKYIYFSSPNNSNDPGYILHETSNSETNEGVLHLVPSDDNAENDYVSIHGTNDADRIRLHTSGLIETANSTDLEFRSASGTIKTPDNIQLESSANLVFYDTNGTFPTAAGAFKWTLNNDSASIYAQQPQSDYIDFFFKITDNASSTDRFVFWIDDYRGSAQDKYPAQFDGSAQYLSVPVDGSGNKDLSNARFKVPFSGDVVIDGSKVWHAGNDGSGSGLDADTVDGVHASSFFQANNALSATTGAFSGDVTINADLAMGSGGQIQFASSATRDKLRLWGSSAYAIGMDDAMSFGALNDYAMTFQFNDDADRGFWWGHHNHSDAQGAMSLTTGGKLVVADSFRVGGGTSDTTAPAADIDMAGTGAIKVANGTTAQRPTGANGLVRYNTTLGALESYVQGAWQVIANTALDYGLITSASDTTFDYGALS